MTQTDDFPEPRDPGPDRRDNIASAGLDPDTWTELEEWRTDQQLSRSEGTRRLIRTGLDSQTNDDLKSRLTRATILAFLTGYPVLATYYGHPDTAAGFVIVLTLGALFEPQISAALDRLKQLLP